MDEIESEEKLSRKSSQKKNKKDSDKLKERIQEFQLWHDNDTFLQKEYEERRSRKQRQKGAIRSDKRLQMAKICYIPSFICIMFGGCLLLLSSIDGLAADTMLWENKIYFQISSAVLLSLGLVMLMGVAVYTYRREDSVRFQFGFPTLYEAAQRHQASGKELDDTFTFTCDFVDRSNSQSRMSRMTSIESKASLSNLGMSFSSTSTTMSWLHKHKRELDLSANSGGGMKRENSDSALETFFARRNRILSTQDKSPMLGNNNNGSDEDDGGDAFIDEIESKSKDGVHDSPAYSSSSTSSSGYHSNISSPTQQKTKPLFTYPPHSTDSVSERDRAQAQRTSPSLDRDMPGEVTTVTPTVTIPLVPIIKIETVVS